MDYPLIIQGKRAGSLNVERQGLYTYISARAEAREGLLRVWVQGGGKEAYLGLMQPEEGGLYLCRRLSRRDMERFPEEIERASDRQLADEEGEEPEERSGSIEPVKDSPMEKDMEAEPGREQPAPVPAQPTPVEEEILWMENRDGSLTAISGEQRLLALPAKLRRVPEGARLRNICGRDYLVFRY